MITTGADYGIGAGVAVAAALAGGEQTEAHGQGHQT